MDHGSTKPDDAAKITAMKNRAALLSVFASVALTAGKTLAAVLSGSLALYSEAFHGLIDVAATLTTYFALKVADKPADDGHHYGHGKVESLAALAETALLFALAGAVAWRPAIDSGTGIRALSMSHHLSLACCWPPS